MNNTIERMNTTTLGGALVYVDGAWRWADGTPAPEVRPLTLRDVAPNFRIGTGHVEVPKHWQEGRYWNGGQVDADAVRAIETLLAKRPATMIFDEASAERVGDHQLHAPGYRIPVAEWDAAMGFVIGAQWDMADQSAIYAKAEAVRAGLAASEMGRQTSERKTAAARKNAQRAGRKTAAVRCYGVTERLGYFAHETRILSAHTTKGAAKRAMGTGYTDERGEHRQPLCIVHSQEGFAKGETVYGDMFPQVVE